MTSSRKRPPLWKRFPRALAKWQADDGPMLAAAVAYYATLSLLPLLLILISMLGFALRISSEAQDAQAELLHVLARNMSPKLAGLVENILVGVEAKAGIGGPLGFLGLLVAAIGIFAQFEYAFHRIWNVPTPERGFVAAVRNAMWRRFKAFLMLAGLGLLVILVFAAGTFSSTIRPWTERVPGGQIVWSLMQIPVSVVLNAGLFTVIYKVLPKVKVRWSEAARGAVVTAVLWEIARQVLALGLIGGRYSAYGVIGSVFMVMLWIYVAACIVFLGAEYVQVICRDCNPEDAAPD